MGRFKVFSGVFLLTSFILLTNCSKNEFEINQTELLGTWISIDKSDTLDFTTANDFYKSNRNFHYDHFDYQRYKDSIEIRYRGIYYIGVPPTKHLYSLEDNKLTIDFTNKGCYGFGNQIMIYEKETQ